MACSWSDHFSLRPSWRGVVYSHGKGKSFAFVASLWSVLWGPIRGFQKGTSLIPPERDFTSYIHDSIGTAFSAGNSCLLQSKHTTIYTEKCTLEWQHLCIQVKQFLQHLDPRVGFCLLQGTSKHIYSMVGNKGAMGTSLPWSRVSKSGPFTTYSHDHYWDHDGNTSEDTGLKQGSVCSIHQQ